MANRRFQFGSRSPVLNPSAFQRAPRPGGPYGGPVPGQYPQTQGGLAGTGGGQRVMTVDGTISKTAILLILLVSSAAFTWSQVLEGGVVNDGILPVVIITGLVGLVVALVTAFRPLLSPYTAPAYALIEGVFVGGISAFYAASLGGAIVPQAVGLTFAVLGIMLALYRFRVIRVTQRFRAIVMAATFGILVLYLANFALSMFGVNIPFLHESGFIGIGISLVICTIAALNLLLDFDFIEQASRYGADERMEWYGAFGLVVTLVWLYLELLRLLRLFAGRD
jgi:uncharacterized YccA/Bax inhibitor family protein